MRKRARSVTVLSVFITLLLPLDGCQWLLRHASDFLGDVAAELDDFADDLD